MSGYGFAVDTAWLVVTVVLAGIVAASLVRSRTVVPERHWALVERLGSYRRTLRPGRHLLVPGLEAVRSLVDMDEQVLELPGTAVVTHDDHMVLVDTVLRYRIVDPVRASYEISDYRTGLAKLIAYALRSHLGERTRDDAFASWATSPPELLAIVAAQAEVWGIRVVELRITRVEPGSR
jgi:regulator of protease activity HflC (stomatin/prohibitin superfamily)